MLKYVSNNLIASRFNFIIYIIIQERKQFGQTIANFQTTQFKLADMAGKIQASRLMIR